ncbi:MAG: RNA-binding cell elongation regulator Jag/EloR [Bacillota bacterium]
MKQVEKRGKTVDEAVKAALRDLGVPQEQVEIEVIEEPSKALFGLLGGREARVVVRVRTEDRAVVARRLLEDVLGTMDLEVEISVEDREGATAFNLEGPDLGILIGRRGQTVDALQYLVNLAANRTGDAEKVRFIIDVEGYRRRREETLRSLAERLADRVQRSGRSVVLEPMSAQERRIIHLALQQNSSVETQSEGEEPQRHVVISVKR